MDNIKELILNAESAVSDLFDGLEKTIYKFNAIDIGFMTVPESGKCFNSAIHSGGGCKNAVDLAKFIKLIEKPARTNEILFRDFTNILEDK